VAGWQCVGWIGRGSAVILSGGKSIIHFFQWWGGCLAVWLWLCGCGCLTSGSGGVAVRGLDRVWQCGHFEWWQVDNPGWTDTATVGCVALAVGGSGCFAVAVWQWQWRNEWQWRGGSDRTVLGSSVRSF
jgi:hypothetical protein